MQSDTMKNLFLKSLKTKQIAVAVVFALVFLTIVSLGVYEGNKKTVTLTANGEQQEVRTHATTVSELLAKQDIEVSEYDVVTPSLDAKIQNGLKVQWDQSQQVAITVDDEQSSVWTTKRTVQEILKEAGIELKEYDEVSPALTSTINDENSIVVDKAYLFTLVDGGEEKEFWSTATTIGEFLDKEQIELSDLDKVNGELDQVIQPQSTVQIVRVDKEVKTIEEEEKFTIETKSDDSLLKGQEKVVQKGQKGLVAKEYEIVLEDGKEVSRSLLSEKTVKEPKKQVVAVGTKVVMASAGNTSSNNTVSRGDSTPAGGKEFYVEATAYTPYCNGCSGISAAGINLRANPNLKLIAVDPRVIPLGTKVWVEGYGYAIAGDTGGAIKGNKIDLLMQTKDQAYKFGRRQVKIKVMN